MLAWAIATFNACLADSFAFDMIVENIWDWYWWYDRLQLYVIIPIIANAVCIAQRLIPPAKVIAVTRCEMLVSLDWLENKSIVPHS